MTRSMWSGTILFGIVSIPTKLYVATEETRVAMNMLCREHRSPISYRRVCSGHNHEVELLDIVKGVSVNGQWITFTDAQLASLAQGGGKTVRIEEFVPAATVPGVYRQASYYIAPDKGGERAYSLLTAALQAEGVVGIAKVCLRGDKERLCMVTAESGQLMLVTLHWSGGVREFAIPSHIASPVVEKELMMARQLVASLSSEAFDPSQHVDRYADKVTELIDGEVIAVEEVPDTQPVLDLMAALKASVEQAKLSKTA